MNRHYSSAEYKTLCGKLRAAFPDATITTDLLVGFPEETDEDFEASLAFVREIGFEKIHVFPYSLRPGTNAAKMQQVDPKVKDERTHRALALADELRRDFFEKQIGKTVNVLCEAEEEGVVSGYTENYTPVKFNSDGHPLNNAVVKVRITGSEHDNLIGKLCSAG